jgi:hypothetical protein
MTRLFIDYDENAHVRVNLLGHIPYPEFHRITSVVAGTCINLNCETHDGKLRSRMFHVLEVQKVTPTCYFAFGEGVKGNPLVIPNVYTLSQYGRVDKLSDIIDSGPLFDSVGVKLLRSLRMGFESFQMATIQMLANPKGDVPAIRLIVEPIEDMSGYSRICDLLTTFYLPTMALNEDILTTPSI